jgi:hypothetical protein
MVRDPGQLTSSGRNHPYVAVVVPILLLAGAIGHERDPGPVGGPLRAGVVPEVSLGELARLVRQSDFSQSEKASFKKTLGQIVLNLYQREVKDVWAELEEVRN